MPAYEALLAFAVALGSLGLIVVATKRLASQDAMERSRGLPSGMSGALADLNEMLQPQQASVETLARLREGEDEGEEDDDTEPLEPPVGT